LEYLYAVVDYGSSALKVVFSKELTDTPKYFAMQPEIIEVPVEAVEEYRQKFLSDPVRYAFVGIQARYYAVGELAQEAFRSTLNLAEPKSNKAVGRTLAAIAAAVRLSQIKVGRKFQLFLSCLLPPGELQDRDILEENLRQALLDFDTPLGRLQVNLKYFNCHPEGGGLALFYEHHRGDLADRQLGVIMMGHRNSSCFTVQKGIYRKFRSSDLGFATVVNDIQAATTSAYKDRTLTAAVASYLLSNEEDKAPLANMLLRDTPSARERELDKLLQAIDLSKRKFWNSFSQWLTVQFPFDEIVFGGGVAELFESEMLDYLNGKLPNLPDKNCPAIYLHGGLNYSDNTLISADLQARFADVQCLWEKDIMSIAMSYHGNNET
jgi:hypothetical protein